MAVSECITRRFIIPNRPVVFSDYNSYHRSSLKTLNVDLRPSLWVSSKASNRTATTNRILGLKTDDDLHSSLEDANRLFDNKHIMRWTPSLVLYCPFGFVIALFRMSLWIGGVLLDADWFRSPAVISAYLTLLGFRSTWHHTERLPPVRHVLVSNHVMPGDLMVLFKGLPQRYIHLITTGLPSQVISTKNLPCELQYATPEVYEQLASCREVRQWHPSEVSASPPSKALVPVHEHDDSSALINGRSTYLSLEAGDDADSSAAASTCSHGRQTTDVAAVYNLVGVGNKADARAASENQQPSHCLESTVHTVRSLELDPPIHLFPEGGVTNGRWGMMQFSRGFTRLLRPGEPVVPVVLRAKTPWDIRTHTLTSSFLGNLFWLSFCPWIEVHATVLPPLQQTVGESKAAFVKRVQGSIAEASGLVISKMNISAKRKLMKQQN